MVVLLISRDAWQDRAEAESADIVRFHESVPRECVEYILWDDRIEFLGSAGAVRPKPWGTARFKKREGQWIPRSRAPVRFDAQHSYVDFDDWLKLGIRRILGVLGAATAIEVFSSLYAMIDPWDALDHERVLDALEDLCGPPKQARRGLKQFSLPGEGKPAPS